MPTVLRATGTYAGCPRYHAVNDALQRTLDRDGVRGTRLGVVRQLFTPQNTDPDVMKRMEQALADLRRLGATIVDPVQIPEIDSIPPGMLFCFRFKADINDYLSRVPNAPVGRSSVWHVTHRFPSVIAPRKVFRPAT